MLRIVEKLRRGISSLVEGFAKIVIGCYRTKNNVFLEYYVPGNVFDEGLYRWKQHNKSKGNQDMRVDLVVKKEDEYVPIEIKYKTKIKQENEIKRFGLSMTGITLTKDQSAQDLGRYDFWRDVRRLELLGKKFDKVKNGTEKSMDRCNI